MKEVRLYRGKPVDKIDRETYGEWVEGYYLPTPFVRWPCRPAIYPKSLLDEGEMRPVEIVPETLGQHIGIKDISGKPIFEGDILEIWALDVPDLKDTGVVCYDQSRLKYEVCSPALTIGSYFGGLGNAHALGLPIKVVGNIHDNPEWWYGTPEWWRGIMEE